MDRLFKLQLFGELAGWDDRTFGTGNHGPYRPGADLFAQEVNATIGEDRIATADVERERLVVQTAVVQPP